MRTRTTDLTQLAGPLQQQKQGAVNDVFIKNHAKRGNNGHTAEEEEEGEF
jgi:hypothetical protein